MTALSQKFGDSVNDWLVPKNPLQADSLSEAPGEAPIITGHMTGNGSHNRNVTETT